MMVLHILRDVIRCNLVDCRGQRVPLVAHSGRISKSETGRDRSAAPMPSKQMKPKAFNFLVIALSSVAGMENYLALKDVCQVDDATADQVAESVVQAILDKPLPRDL